MPSQANPNACENGAAANLQPAAAGADAPGAVASLTGQGSGSLPLGESPRAFSPPATRRGAASGPAADPVASLAPKVEAPGASQITPLLTGPADSDCGTCLMCLDKPKFGGPGIKRKGCLAKRTSAVGLRPPASTLIESVVKAPALGTPELSFTGTPEMSSSHPSNSSSSAPSSGEGAALPWAGSGPSSGPSSVLSGAGAGLAGPYGGLRDRSKGAAGLREQLLRKEYSLRKRGAEAGEMILSEPAETVPAVSNDADERSSDASSSLSRVTTGESDATMVGNNSEETPDDAGCAEGKAEEAQATSPCQACDAEDADDSSASAAGAAVSTRANSGKAKAAKAGVTSSAAASSSANGVDDFSTVRLVGAGLIEDEEGAGASSSNDSPRPPLNELLNYKNGVPCTPQLKTPEIEALASEGALGMSPLSQFASLLDMTPRLPEEQQAAALAASASAGGARPFSGGGQGGMSPLWQLASLMETPGVAARLPDEEDSAGGKRPKQSADPEELRDALLNGGLESPQPTDTPGQLRRDLSNALLQAGALASPHLPNLAAAQASSSMPPPPPMPFGGKGSVNLQKQRKRKLEADLGLGGGSGMLVRMEDGMEGEGEDGEERLMLRELLEDGGLGLPMPGAAKPAKRSKAKQKDKGKPVTCRCDRSGCLKRYCVCFAAGNACVAGSCKCKGCENDDATEERRLKRAAAVAEMQKKKANAFQARIGPTEDGAEAVHLTGCNCKRSGCIRRYCECFQSGVKCTDKCKCCECKNPAGTNPNARPMPAEVPKGPGSPGTGVELSLGAAAAAIAGGGSPKMGDGVANAAAFSPLKLLASSPGAKAKGLSPAAPSPTAFVDTALLAAAAVSRRDASGTEGGGTDAEAEAAEGGALDAPSKAAPADGDSRGSASGEWEGEDSELMEASAAKGAVGGFAPAGLPAVDKGRVSCGLPPLNTSLPTPTPDEFASDTPEPQGDSRGLGPTPPAAPSSASPKGVAPLRWAPNPKDGAAFQQALGGGCDGSMSAPVAERPGVVSELSAEVNADVTMVDAPSLVV